MTNAAKDDAPATPELRTQVRRWFVETGYVDGNGIGIWEATEESAEVSSKKAAEDLRDEWEATGKLVKTHWGELRPNWAYGSFRIRSVWEDATPEALAASPVVQAMLREARAEGMERAQMLARRLANDSEREAERKETTAQQRIGLHLVRDTAGTLEAAIRAEAAAVRKGETK